MLEVGHIQAVEALFVAITTIVSLWWIVSCAVSSCQHFHDVGCGLPVKQHIAFFTTPNAFCDYDVGHSPPS